MGLFKKEQKKQDGGEWIVKMALQEAMRELEIEKDKNILLRKDLKLIDECNISLRKIREKDENDIKNLENNLEVLKNTIENIRNICKSSNEDSINLILKELGE